MSRILITTTNTIDGHNILAYQNIVSAEVVLGANVFKDFFASLRDFFGGRSKSYEHVLQDAKEQALEELKRRAAQVDADALVGVTFDYFSVGAQNSIMVVCATGTAVRLQPNN